METCFACEEKSGNVVVVMGTSVSKVNDLFYGVVWDCCLVICLCLVQHLAERASCLNIREVDRQAELSIVNSVRGNLHQY